MRAILGFCALAFLAQPICLADEPPTVDQMSVTFLKEGELDSPRAKFYLQSKWKETQSKVDAITQRTKIFKGAEPQFKLHKNLEFFVCSDTKTKKEYLEKYKDKLAEVTKLAKSPPRWCYPGIDIAEQLRTGDIGFLTASGWQTPALRVVQLLPPDEAIVSWGRSTFYLLDFEPTDIVDGNRFQTKIPFYVDGTKTYKTLNGTNTVFALRAISKSDERKMMEFVSRFHVDAIFDKMASD